ncbi:hypothetical protein LVY75_35355 (plasmid) [Sinorhizobium sp. B11]
MRFFFHLRDEDSYEEDQEGIEFPSLAQAVAEARRSAREMVAELVLHDDVIDGRSLEIAGDDGSVLATVAFKDAVRMQ